MSADNDPAALTPRQREILELLSKGLTNLEISAALGISDNTVRVHVAAILSSLGATNRTEAAFLYRQQSEAALALAAVRRPAIAVLPFADLASGDDHDHVADGLTEDLIARLSAWRWFVVISHASSWRYAKADLEQIRRELGAAYVVTASVRRAADSVRVSVHLSDTTSGTTLHASSIDAPMQDVFATQDELCRRIIARLAPELMQAAGADAARSIDSGSVATEAVAAWRHAVRGMWLLNQQAVDVALAHAAFDEAVRIDSRCMFAWYGRCLLYQHLIWEQLTDNPARDVEALCTAARECLRLAPDAWQSRTAAGLAAMLSGDRDAAEHHLRAALASNPSSSRALTLLAQCHGMAGRFTECAAALEDALRLNLWSGSRWVYESSLGVTHFLAGDHTSAIARLEDALRDRPEAPPSVLVVLAAVYAECGALDAAAATVERLRSTGPFDLERHIVSIGAVAAPQFIERFRLALRRAGLDA